MVSLRSHRSSLMCTPVSCLNKRWRWVGFNALQYFLQTLLADHRNQFSQNGNAGGGGLLAGMAVDCQFRSAGSDAVAHFLCSLTVSLYLGRQKDMSQTNQGCFFSM